ncbi:hypothetical protein [Terriglobus roseus]|uniref:Uncharacterized protein n=1 Tax=Terriglobus roseus TaxID=392734 RepID=A0A1G7JBD2_9BACT|nr:hypothetical protein [Terriglobus roseus]SDF22196.1 hypothetical protein SAMN05444167_1757 [Terriglobus roseus]
MESTNVSVTQKQSGIEASDRSTVPASPKFLLMQGGPFYYLEQRVGLIRKGAPLTIRRAVFAACLTWVPLLVLTLMHGTAFDGVRIPFLRDFSVHSRFLLGIPLLMLAELVLAPRIAETAEQFLLARIIHDKDVERFNLAIKRGLRLRDSVTAEVIIALIAYSITWITYRQLAVHASTWYLTDVGNGSFELTGAGWWQLLIAVPLLQFLVFRWLWRIFLWVQFLATVSKLDLRLFPTHPDAAGGLGFIGEGQRFFGILLFAYSCAVTGVIANEVVYAGFPLQHFTAILVAWVIVALLLTTVPLIVFAGKLLVCKREGLHRYGAFATTYTGSFDRKWIEGDNPEHETLLGTGDIQSLADLGNSYEFIERMKPIPINPKSLLQIVVLSLIPMASLLLTVMPLKDVFKLLMKVLM